MAARPPEADLWRGGVVPYEINPDLANTAAIHDSIKIIEKQTNIRFVGRLRQEDYVRFSKQTAGNPNSQIGRQGGRQYLNSSVSSIGAFLHEMGHAVGLMHEHQRSDRDDHLIYHPERVTENKDQYEKRSHISASVYDIQSIMHYGVDINNPIFESRAGLPLSTIGSQGVLTQIDKDFLSELYPAPPIIRRSDGEGAAGKSLQNSAVAYIAGNGTALIANAIENGSSKYQLILWRVDSNGGVRRTESGAAGGKATDIHITRMQSGLLVSAMNASGILKLISHDTIGKRLFDSGSQAGAAQGIQIAAAINSEHVITGCIAGSGKLLLILWKVDPNGSIHRIVDSNSKGPSAEFLRIAPLSTVSDTTTLAVLHPNGRHLVLSIWEVSPSGISKLADSGTQIGESDMAELTVSPTGHIIVSCRAEDKRLLLIPFIFSNASINRLEGEAKSGRIEELSCIARPDGVLTSVISSDGHLLLERWRVLPDGRILRQGNSGTQAGEASALCTVPLHFPDRVTICTFTSGSTNGALLPITWDDTGGPGELWLV
jgi:hypothetical protein